MKILIKNGRMIDPASRTDGIRNIACADGKIVSISEAAPAGFTPERTIDAAGLIVLPGLVDLAARLREPGYEHKTILDSEMQAAVSGGVTSLLCPPDTSPVLDEPGLVEMLKYRTAARNQAHVYPLGALTVGLLGQKITEMSKLTDAGCVGFSNATEPIADTEVLMRAMQYASSFNYTSWLQTEDPFLARNGVAHAGIVAAELGLIGIPAIAETIRLYTIFELIRETGARVHLCRLSTADGIDMVRQAKKEGLPVTCDVGIHYLHLTEEDIGYFDTNARLTPPLRSAADRDAISKGLLDGTIDAICSDHNPVDDDEKLLPFEEAAAGATGLELFLPLVLKWAKNQSAVPDILSLAAGKITAAPAAIAGLPCGKLEPGADADICIFDPEAVWTVNADTLASQGKHTPFLGKEVPGRVRYTLVSGRIAHELS